MHHSIKTRPIENWRELGRKKTFDFVQNICKHDLHFCYHGCNFGAKCKLEKKIKEYKLSIGRDGDEEIQEVKLEPYSDFDQIQADEQEALRLHREFNDELRDIGNSALFRLLRERNSRIIVQRTRTRDRRTRCRGKRQTSWCN